MKKTVTGKIKLIIILLAILGLCGCGFGGLEVNPTDGECGLDIAFVDIPDEYYSINSNIRESLNIIVCLENILTEKNYWINLNEGNGYKFRAMLSPGTYLVKSVYCDKTDYTGMILCTDAETIDMQRGMDMSLGIRISNADEFQQCFASDEKPDTIVYMSMFSRSVMIDGKTMNIQQLGEVLAIDTDAEIKAYSRETYTDEERGIRITYLNDSGQSARCGDCRVVAVEVTRNNVVFPRGVTLGMNDMDVCGKEGLYGTPSSFGGSIMYGLGWGSTFARYLDPVSGDRLTVELASGGRYVCGLKYETEVFDE